MTQSGPVRGTVIDFICYEESRRSKDDGDYI